MIKGHLHPNCNFEFSDVLFNLIPQGLNLTSLSFAPHMGKIQKMFGQKPALNKYTQLQNSSYSSIFVTH